MSKHTSGPWKPVCDRRRVTPWVIESYAAHIADVQRCVSYGKEIDGEAEANARLIAAAPDLAEAVEALMTAKWSSDKDNMEFTVEMTCFTRDKLVAAIRKARGE